MQPSKSHGHQPANAGWFLPDRDLTQPGRGNLSEPRPAEAERAVSGGEPSPHSGMRAAHEAVDDATTGTLPAQGVTLRTAMSRDSGGRFTKKKKKKPGETCYHCETEMSPQLFRPLDGPSHEGLRSIAELMRESALNYLDRKATGKDKLCANCHRVATQRLEAHEHNRQKVLFDVVETMGLRGCIFCLSKVNVRVVSFDARVKVYVDTGKFIMRGSRICLHHLRPSDGSILPLLADELISSKRHVFLDSQDIQDWFAAFRKNVIERCSGILLVDRIPEEDFKVLTSVSKQNFEDMLSKSVTEAALEGEECKMNATDLLMFLVKLRQGLSDEFLRVMFRQSTRANVSMRISVATKTLMQKFVPLHLGLEAISRDTFVAEHVSDFACNLYVDDFKDIGSIKQAVIVVDGTYIYIPKLNNYRVARQSFSVHKKRHLIKPVMLTGTNGYILDVHGPYFADGKNNDAAILRHHMEQDGINLKTWLQPNDVLLLDRGYRDVLDYLQSHGFKHKMPEYLRKNMKQHTVEEANKSRLVTKSRWVVESRNGHLKSTFKIFRDEVDANQVQHVGDYFRIACAIINAYHPKINMLGADESMAERMKAQANTNNELKNKIEREKLQQDNSKSPWFPMDAAECLPGFPRLDLDYLRDLTYGTYQIKHSKSYSHDKMSRDSQYQIKINLRLPGILRANVYSRHTNKVKYETWVWYRETHLPDSGDAIKGWYCTCKPGARTLGCCAHISSIMWYLGYARHLEKVPAPSDKLLYTILDAGKRPVVLDVLEQQEDDE